MTTPPSSGASPSGASSPGDMDADLLRAGFYDLLAVLLARPPPSGLLEACARLSGDGDTPIGDAVNRLARAAGTTSPGAAEAEFTALFIGLGRGEVVPYLSYYLTGFLNEKPLARLRGTMAELGIARSADVHEPEDNMASLMEIQAGLIRGDFGTGPREQQERSFFAACIGPWGKHLFTDIRKAPSAHFYAAVASLGLAFLEAEDTAFRAGGDNRDHSGSAPGTEACLPVRFVQGSGAAESPDNHLPSGPGPGTAYTGRKA